MILNTIRLSLFYIFITANLSYAQELNTNLKLTEDDIPSSHEIDSIFRTLVTKDSLAYYTITEEVNKYDEILNYLNLDNSTENIFEMIPMLEAKKPEALSFKKFRLEDIDLVFLNDRYPELEKFSKTLYPKDIKIQFNQSQIAINYWGKLMPLELSILDTKGNLAFYVVENNFGGQLSKNIDLGTWKDGSYLLRIIQDQSAYYKLIMLENLRL